MFTVVRLLLAGWVILMVLGALVHGPFLLLIVGVVLMSVTASSVTSNVATSAARC